MLRVAWRVVGDGGELGGSLSSLVLVSGGDLPPPKYSFPFFWAYVTLTLLLLWCWVVSSLRIRLPGFACVHAVPGLSFGVSSYIRTGRLGFGLGSGFFCLSALYFPRSDRQAGVYSLLVPPPAPARSCTGIYGKT